MTDGVCTRSWHEALKRVRRAFEVATRFVGWQPDVDGAPLELRNCRLCGSTMCDGTRQTQEMAHAA
jgi:hypothetical protein